MRNPANFTHDHKPSYLVTTCCYGGHTDIDGPRPVTATHREFTPDGAVPFLALCKYHARKRRAAGAEVVAYSTLVRLASEAFGKQYDWEKAGRRAIIGRQSDAIQDRACDMEHMWDQRLIERSNRAEALCWLGGTGSEFDDYRRIA